MENNENDKDMFEGIKNVLLKRTFRSFIEHTPEEIEDKEKLLDHIRILKELSPDGRVDYIKTYKEVLDLTIDLDKVDRKTIKRSIDKYINLEPLIQKDVELLKEVFNEVDSGAYEEERFELFKVVYDKYAHFKLEVEPNLFDLCINRRN